MGRAISHCVDTPPNNKTKQNKIARESLGCEGDINCFRRYSLWGGELGVLCKLLDNKLGTGMKYFYQTALRLDNLEVFLMLQHILCFAAAFSYHT